MNGLFDLSGKVALVSGGGKGIGAMIAQGPSAHGARVYVASRHPAGGAVARPNPVEVPCQKR